MSNSPSLYEIEIKVRDYECDMQGVVNNSVYQNYLEHARHEMLLSKGVSFADLAKQGINLVVTRIELDYKSPLRSGDSCRITSTAQKEGRIRNSFSQEIFRLSDNQLVAQAKVFWVAVNAKGKPFISEEVARLYDQSEPQAGCC